MRRQVRECIDLGINVTQKADGIPGGLHRDRGPGEIVLCDTLYFVEIINAFDRIVQTPTDCIFNVGGTGSAIHNIDADFNRSVIRKGFALQIRRRK